VLANTIILPYHQNSEIIRPTKQQQLKNKDSSTHNLLLFCRSPEEATFYTMTTFHRWLTKTRSNSKTFHSYVFWHWHPKHHHSCSCMKNHCLAQTAELNFELFPPIKDPNDSLPCHRLDDEFNLRILHIHQGLGFRV
jgi:hypothetical protein